MPLHTGRTTFGSFCLSPAKADLILHRALRQCFSSRLLDPLEGRPSSLAEGGELDASSAFPSIRALQHRRASRILRKLMAMAISGCNSTGAFPFFRLFLLLRTQRTFDSVALAIRGVARSCAPRMLLSFLRTTSGCRISSLVRLLPLKHSYGISLTAKTACAFYVHGYGV